MVSARFISFGTAILLAVSATGLAANDQPVSWADAFQLRNDRISAAIFESPTKISLRGFSLKSAETKPVLDLEIDWLSEEKPTGFQKSFNPKTGISRVSYRLGSTTITRTAFASAADDAIFLHFIADQPGALSFKTRIVSPDPENAVIQNRVQLSWQGKGENTGLKAAVWVLPFESDVERDENSIVLRGEGECIVIVNFTGSDDPAKPVSETLRRLGDAYDPGHQPPDPIRIWHAVLAKHSPPAK